VIGGDVAAIILAAGESKRFGSPKQLLDWRGQPLLRHVVWQALAAPVCEIVVVLGAHYARVAPIIHGLPVTLARNSHWQAGMSSSVSLGLQALRDDADAAIFLLADQPQVSPELMGRLIAAYAESGSSIVVPSAQGRRGNPALFARELFPELMLVSGDLGGRALMERYGEHIHWVDADARVLFDIDEPGDVCSSP
jgi:molybdenum cofactor cytidylyltransferase